MALKDHSEKLPLFIAVYEHSNMRRAAIALNMTQPPLSYAIKQLEEDLQVQLFIRSKKGVEPTLQGEKLYHFSKRILRELDQVEQEVKTPEDKMAGVISIGTYDSIARYFGPNILSESAKMFPNLRLRLSSNRSTDNISLLVSKDIDYSILVEPGDLSPTSNLQKNPLYTDTYGIFRKKSLSKEKMNFIYVGDAYAEKNLTLEELLKPHLAEYQELKLDSFEVCRELIKKGVGLGVLPNRVAEDDLKAGLLEKISLKGFGKKRFGKHTIFECYLKESQEKEKIQEFSKVVKGVLTRRN